MREMSIEKKVLVLREGEAAEETVDKLILEAPFTIFLNGSELVTLLCTPEKMDRLALGFLKSEGLLQSPEQVESLRVREEEGIAEVELKDRSPLAERIYGKRAITSGCGKGTVFYHALDSLRSNPVRSKTTVSAQQIREHMQRFQELATVYKATGGTHSAALADLEQVLFFCEDIGRHNAVDKIVGECLLAGISLEDKILLTSGRLSSEILLKAAKLQLPVVVSRAAPTSLCVELAEKLQITLIGFARGRRMNIYACPERIKPEG